MAAKSTICPRVSGSRGRALAALGAAVLLGGCGSDVSHSPSQLGPTDEPRIQTRPNLVVVETDDQSFDTLRFMPSVRRLVGGAGVTFDNSFASLPQCCPSRATFLTGQYAHNHGVLSNTSPGGGYYKLDNRNTLAVWLQRAGYYTALVGKYLNEYGKKDQKEVPPGWSRWLALVEDPYFNYVVNDDGKVIRGGAAPGDYQTDYLTRRANQVIRSRARSNRPFFVWLAYGAPHRGTTGKGDESGPKNAVPAPRHADRFRSLRVPKSLAFDEADVTDKPRGVRALPRLEGTRRASRVAERYRHRAEALLAVDEGVRSVIATLRATGELDRTFVIYTSDNGFLLGQHRVPSGKLLPYEPSIRVPLMMRGPGIPSGHHRDELVANIDLAPTLIDAARASAGRAQDGSSLLGVARSDAVRLDRDLLLESGTEAHKAESPMWVGIRTRRYVYVEYGNGERELYDLRRDPSQVANAAGSPRYRAVQADLSARLARLRRCRGSGCRGG